jgi:hypothetical protein
MGACHITLSGLELQMHDEHEIPFVWWYGFQVHRSLNEKLEMLEKECSGKSVETGGYLRMIKRKQILKLVLQITFFHRPGHGAPSSHNFA